MLLVIAGCRSHLALVFSWQVDCPFPPSDKIGINSVQRENEEIVPMKAMKMAWVPYIPLEDRYGTSMLYKAIFVAYCFLPTYSFSLVIKTYISHFGYCFVYRLSRIDSLKTKIFTLGCTQRRSVDL